MAQSAACAFELLSLSKTFVCLLVFGERFEMKYD